MSASCERSLSYQKLSVALNHEFEIDCAALLQDKSGVDKIIVKKATLPPAENYREFFISSYS